MVGIALLAVVAALFAVQVALVVYAGLRRSGGGVRGADPPSSDRGSSAGSTASEPRDRPEPARDGDVRCHACGASNDDAYRFCRGCATRLPEAGGLATGRVASGGTAR